jgi:tetrapyrrole methylase family protein/MazG family protein
MSIKDDFHHDKLGEFSTFKKVIEKLRSATGCPWDRKQTHATLKQYLLEECYEVLEAIDEDDMPALCEELGDLWLQIMLHAQIAKESREFTLQDVLRKINSKLIHRHPHVFGDKKVTEASEAAVKWEELKEQEKQGNSSLLASVPKNLPALAYSQSIQGRAASVGFDWPSVDNIVDKLEEEIEELRRVENHEQKIDEFGDILFTLANIARRLDVELESALRRSNTRFYKRFSYIEENCTKRGLTLKNLTLQEMDVLWDEAKKALG